MIVELTGIPGSGKTTFWNHLRSALPRIDCATLTPFAALAGRLADQWCRSTAIRNRIIELSHQRQSPSTSHQLFWRQMSRAVSDGAMNPSELRRLNRAIKRQYRITELAPTIRDCLLVDEGVLHLCAMTALRSSSPKSTIHQLTQHLPWPQIVILVETDAATAERRLSQRGAPPFCDRAPAIQRQMTRDADSVLRRLLALAPSTTKLFTISNHGTDRGRSETLKQQTCGLAQQIKTHIRQQADSNRTCHQALCSSIRAA